MAGFRALAEQVRDPDRAPSQRRQALRRCLERFAPYGHRATWHHLCRRAGFHPDDRDPDPALLVEALDELERARDVWLAYEEEVAERRRREKQEGIRQPTALDGWHTLTWGGRSLLPCKDPTAPPDTHLADVLNRLIRAMERAAAPTVTVPPAQGGTSPEDSAAPEPASGAAPPDGRRMAGTAR
ncbi:hypothetical protein [Streptomyces sp. TR06-5]|uniref:hypothetical protein n=1 Tax=Streptomyces sp. TR06-5 TaxID=3385976 RepID=UPI00399F4856